MVDINLFFLLSQTIHFGLLFAWFLLGFRALKYLHRAKLSESILLLWVAIVIFVPLIGALAVLNVRPNEQRTELL